MKTGVFLFMAVAVLSAGGADLRCDEPKSAGAVLAIEWQRLVDEKGETCDRCGGTEKELRRGVETLRRSLRPLGIRVTLEKRPLGPDCAKDIIDSNRIVMAGKSLEEWLGAKIGASACGSCCAKLGETVECRTTTFDGKTYEVIPAELIVKAGMKAASELIVAPPAGPCCPSGKAATDKGGACCPR